VTGEAVVSANAPLGVTGDAVEAPQASILDVFAPRLEVTPFAELPRFLHRGDVLVVNDAATIPASVRGQTASGELLELRLFDPQARDWSAVLFGAGDWRMRTEDRLAPPVLREGASLRIGGLTAQVLAVSPRSARLVRLRFEANEEEVWRMVYRRGAPVQYAHRPVAEPLWAFQNVYASRPWAAEHVSAGRALSWGLLLGLREAGVQVLALTEGAGLSSSGEPGLDAALPLPERYAIPAHTAAAVNAALAEGHRVIAVGTSVMRALESAALETGRVAGGPGLARLVITERHRPRVTAGLLTGIHAPHESHYRLLRALADEATLGRATAAAAAAGLAEHELGDAALLLPGSLGSLTRASA
jgi:S-adenosylmethionine:tRNA ribosyltransferase-isomerase